MKSSQPAGGAGMPYDGLYRGQRVALLTQHGKERVIAPVLDEALGCRVGRVTGYDTDRLGTFTRDIARAGTQLEAARAKARIGMELSGLPLGLASEGAFGLDPFAGMLPWNVERLIFIDDLLDIEVTGTAQAAANSAQLLAASWGEVEKFARASGFPEHHLVLRPEGENDMRIRKGLAGWPELEAAYALAICESPNKRVFVEVDLRAHANPTRLSTIRLAAVDLARRLSSRCPACSLPGFWLFESIPGLPCRACGVPTREVRAEIYGCLKCGHRVTRERAEREWADPGHCDGCNP
ncbi:MAG: hypothetical protein M0Z76_06760 [Gammaproteobacteria bacterium]|nr:hypothetical protein [Gammaproteobacteria bacterium]